MKVKNTYSRKKQGKNGNQYSKSNGKNSKSNVNVNFCMVNVVFNVNFTNINVSQRDQTRPETSKSGSGDTFDQLLKGPTFGDNNPSTSGLLGCGTKFFTKRQDTYVFFNSDAEQSSSSHSNMLFKDSKSSDCYSPSALPSPVPYCKGKNNKLFKITKEAKIAISKKNPYRVQKKHPVVGRKKPLMKVKSELCASSTPTRPNTLLNKGNWPDAYVSPIMPLQCTSRGHSSKKSLSAEEEQNIAEQQSLYGLSAMIEGFGNLGFRTPHHKKVMEIKNDTGKKPELFDYESPAQVLMSFKNRESHRENSRNSDVDTLSKEVEENRKERIPKSNVEHSLKALLNINMCELDREVLNQSRFSSPDQKKFVEDLGELKSGQLASNSLTSVSNDCSRKFEQDISDNSAILSPSHIAIRDSEHLVVNKEDKLDCKSLPLVLTGNNTNEPKNVNDFQDNSVIVSEETKDTDSILNTDFKSENIETENVESYYDNLNQIEEEHEKSKSQGASFFNESDCEKSSINEIKVCNSKVFSNLTNFPSDVTNFENTYEIYKRPICYTKENKRPEHNVIMNKSNFQPLVPEPNESLYKVNLEAGKKWRRSFLRKKQPEAKFDRRRSMTADTLAKLIRESSILSGVSNDTKISLNNTFRSLLEGTDFRNSNMPVIGGSPEFNITLSNLSKVYTKRRRNYICDMNEIPEENIDHSIDKSSNETELNEQDSVRSNDDDQEVNSVCETIDETNINQTEIYETPPILKMNPEALGAITDRKRSHRYRTRSLGECSIYLEVDELEETLEERNDFFTSCCSKLEDDLENLNEQDIQLMGKVGFLLQVGQQGPLSFEEAFPDGVLDDGKKIGEGVFGEVFMMQRPGIGKTVLKIIPIEGIQTVNNEPQKRFDEVLSELIITEELSLLRKNPVFCTSGFCELKGKFFLQGAYPAPLLKLWHEFDIKNRSENDCPEMFHSDQLYLALELAHAGEPVETYRFRSMQQALAVFLQTTFSLAAAESATDFEHRDLHIGNILIQETSQKYISFTLNSTSFECPTYGSLATIIDYTLSRISFKGDVLFLDLEKDPELFTAKGAEEKGGDYQFDIYRNMRSDLNNNWRDHQPKTNVRWLHYLVDKLTSGKLKFKQKKTTRSYKEYMEMMMLLKETILDFHSATDLAQHLIHSFNQTMSLIRT